MLRLPFYLLIVALLVFALFVTGCEDHPAGANIMPPANNNFTTSCSQDPAPGFPLGQFLFRAAGQPTLMFQDSSTGEPDYYAGYFEPEYGFMLLMGEQNGAFFEVFAFNIASAQGQTNFTFPSVSNLDYDQPTELPIIYVLTTMPNGNLFLSSNVASYSCPIYIGDDDQGQPIYRDTLFTFPSLSACLFNISPTVVKGAFAGQAAVWFDGTGNYQTNISVEGAFNARINNSSIDKQNFPRPSFHQPLQRWLRHKGYRLAVRG